MARRRRRGRSRSSRPGVNVPWFISIWNAFWIVKAWQRFWRLDWKLRLLIVLTVAGLMGAGAVSGVRWYRARRSPETYLARGDQSLAEGALKQALQEYRTAVWYAGEPAKKLEVVRALTEGLENCPVASPREAFDRTQQIMAFWYQVLRRVHGDEATIDRVLDYHYTLADTFDLPAFWTGLHQAATTVLKFSPQSLKAHKYRTFAATKLVAFHRDVEYVEQEELVNELATAMDTWPDDAEVAYFAALQRLTQPVPEGTVRDADTVLEALAPLTALRKRLPDNLPAAVYEQRLLVAAARQKHSGELLKRIDSGFQELARLLQSADDPEHGARVVKLVMLASGDPQRKPRFGGAAPRLDDAAKLLDRLHAAYPANRWLAMLKGELRAFRGDLPRAITAYDAALADLTVEPTTEGIRDWAVVMASETALARLWFETARAASTDDARKAAWQRSEEYSKRTEGHLLSAEPPELRQARADLLSGRIQSATAALVEINRKLGGSSAPLLAECGLVLADNGEIGVAREFLRKVVEHPLLDMASYRNCSLALARIELTLNQLDKCRERLGDLAAVWPDDAAIGVLQGQLAVREIAIQLARRKRPDAAAITPLMERLQRWYEAGHWQVVRPLVELHLALGDQAGARRLIVEANGRHPRQPELITTLLYVMYRYGEDGITASEVDGLLGYRRDAPLFSVVRQTVIEHTRPWAFVEQLLALLLDEDQVDTRLKLCRYQLRTGRVEAAEASLAKAVELTPQSPEVLRCRLQVAMAREDFAAAEAVVEEAKTSALEPPVVTYWLALIAGTRKQYESAIDLLTPMLESFPLFTDAWTLLGEVRAATGEQEGAVEAFRNAIALRPDHVPALVQLFRLEQDSGHGDKAKSVLRHAVAVAPRSPDVQRAFSAYLESVDDPKERLEWRKAYAQVNPSDQGNLREIAALYVASGDQTRGLELLEFLWQRSKTRANLLALVNYHHRAGQDDKALKLLQARVAEPAFEKDLAAWLDLARFYRGLGRYQAAADTYGKAVKVAGDASVGVYHEIAEMLLQHGQAGQAQKLYESLFAAGKDLRTGGKLVELLLLQHRPDLAAKVVEELKQAHRDDAQVALLEGRVAAAAGRHEDALAAFDKAARLLPDEPAAYLERARYLLALPNRDAADRVRVQSDLDKLMALAPDSPMPREMLLELHLRDQAPRKAIAVLEALLRDFPDREQYFDQLASLYLRTKALNNLRGLLMREPMRQRYGNRSLWFTWRARLAAATDDADTERQSLAKAFELTPDAPHLRDWVAALTRQLRHEDALKCLDDHSELVTANPLLQAYRGRVLMALGRRTEAVSECRQALGAALKAEQNQEAAPGVVGVLTVALPREDADALLSEFTAASPFCRFSLAQLRLYGKRHTAAVELLRQIWRDEKLPAGLRGQAGRNLVVACQVIGDAATAAEVEKALGWRLEDDVVALNNAAFLIAESGQRPAQAESLAQRALTLAPREQSQLNAVLLDTLGYAQMQAGERDEAERSLRQSLVLQERPDALLHLGQLLAAAGRQAEARKELEAARKAFLLQMNTEKLRMVDRLLGANR